MSALFHGVLFSWFRGQNKLLQPSSFTGAGHLNLPTDFAEDPIFFKKAE
ncbi:MAG: hypothetical protein JNM65_03000 [Verrucomicrobiaceae bacterium]|nr:hypothetical protein [Verrucomicrobiaceae bacterium]